MRIWLGILAVAAGLAACAASAAADYKTLRTLNAGPPTLVSPLPAQTKTSPVQFVRIVIHPKDGEPWAITYRSQVLLSEDSSGGGYNLLPWRSGAAEADKASFGRVFEEELQAAGFQAEKGETLFEETNGAADLKVAVLVDDIKGRFCEDCPSLFYPKGIAATVVMTAQWEIYSSLERKVVGRVTTSGGANYKPKLQGSILPVALEAFRENVRQLLVSSDFRRLVTASPGAATSSAPAAKLTPIALVGPKAHGTVAQAASSVAIVYAADGQGSGFLVSSDGYVITNQHVVGGSKYVKLKWSDGSEVLGEVLRSDARRDVALIKADAKGRRPLALRVGPVQQGETVFAIGTPLDDKLQNTMTKGIVSAERFNDGLRFIQSDVTVNHGNSGGPLIDDKGQVIALTESGRAPNGTPIGFNFFIPIEDALKALALTPAA